MSRYKNAMSSLAEYKSITEYYNRGLKAVAVNNLSDGAKAHFTASFLEDINKNILYIAPTESEAKTITNDLKFFLGDDYPIYVFPKKDYMFHNVEAMSNEDIIDRVIAVTSLQNAEKPVIIVASASSSVQYTLPKEFAKTITFNEGDVFEIQRLVEDLLIFGYIRSEIVEGPGQFSLRGGILDVFSPDSLNPLRIEFFDNEVDTIRSFDPSTQISVSGQSSGTIIPCRELIYSKEKSFISKIKKNGGNSADIDSFENKHYFSSADKYLPYIYSKNTYITDYFEDGIIVADNISKISDIIKSLRQEMAEETTSLMEKGAIKFPSKYEYIADTSIIAKGGVFRVSLSGIVARHNIINVNAEVSFPMKAVQSYLGKEELILEDISYWQKNGYGINIMVGNLKSALTFEKMLKDNGLIPIIKNDILPADKGEIVISQGTLSRGFEYPQYVLIGDKELFGSKKAKNKVRKMSGSRIKSYNDLEIGDYVVHHVHGIGRYTGIHRIEVDGVIKDYLKLVYRDNDILYIPATSLHLINKYVAGDVAQVKLNKMGGTEFSKVKNKVRQSARDMADRLVKLYAKRLDTKGFAFSADTDWQKNFEDDFPFEETEDQLRCINEVKSDMEAIKPMDRLLCGDVGFGKTEIALRAAFKAVMDGKQVAYLVPTTVLARQHYNTFSSRMSDYPITVEMLSRFKKPKQQKDIIKRLAEGNIDVIIGTHKIIQKDVKFKDLGLLIIDEEQRFGVSDKEKIKELKNNIDVLTLSATPIPRTMHMAMIGIRDMSVINEPPRNRYPVQTFVMEHDRDVVREAILKELDRGGQVYYVFNRVEGIEKVAGEIQAMAPNASVAIAHGQMSEKQLEDIMVMTMEGEIDILVCTTIIETGLDIPNINTVIIENADKMGLSQLYQLRGRVGRSTRRAYAYLTYRKNKQINENAEKRLKAIREFTEFGSGFKIALRDLEIRGAGNLLGAEQHGAMDAVGYDMYCKILSEAVMEAKGETVSEEIVTSVDIKLDAYIPEKYIESSASRIEMYKRISLVETEEDVSDTIDELIDRFGQPPQAVINLINIAHIGKLARDCSINEIIQKDDFLLLSTLIFDEKIIKNLCDKNRQNLMFIKDKKPHFLMRIKDRNKLFENIKYLLHEYKQLQKPEI